jgi:hypothetical protein
MASSEKNDMNAKRAAIGIGVWASLLAGCTPGRVLDQFSDPEPQRVTLACGDAYKIYEKQEPRRLVIASGLIQEFTRDGCEGFEKLEKHERFAKVARDHLAGTGRQTCTITSVEPLSLSVYAARYRCPKPGETEAAERERAKRTAKRF